jgi:hypothetical protein
MKNLISKNLKKSSLLLLTILFVESCSSTKPIPELVVKNIEPTSPEFIVAKPVPFKGYNKFCSEVATSLPPIFQNFDKKPYANDAFVIANMIAVVQPELDEQERDTIASQMSVAIKKYNIEPQVFVAIIDTESNFQADKVSSTGDLSLAQINVKVWNKEFNRMNLPLMVKEKVKEDQEYALEKMAQILNIIKQRYEKTDRRWYARYHSNTHKYKTDYLHKLEIRLEMLASSTELKNQIAQAENLKILATNKNTPKLEQAIQANNLVAELLTPTPMPSPIPMSSPQVVAPTSTTEMATLLLKDFLPTSIFK